MSNWTLLSNHGHVIVCLSRDPEARLRDVAADVGITERAVQKIVRDLQDGGMISVTKSGRRNRYRIHKKQKLRHELEAACTLKDLIRFVNRQQAPESTDVAPSGKAVAEAKSGTGAAAERDAEPGGEAVPKPPSNKPKKAKQENAKDSGQDDSKSPDSLEKQQGSLF